MEVILNGKKRALASMRPMTRKVLLYLSSLKYKQFVDYRAISKVVGGTYNSIAMIMRDNVFDDHKQLHEKTMWCGSKRSIQWLRTQVQR